MNDIKIVNGIIPGRKPTKEEVQDLWEAPIGHETTKRLKDMTARSKDKKATVKQIEMFEAKEGKV